MSDILRPAMESRAWPFEEARKILDRLGGGGPTGLPGKGHVLFETGYGPSGLPHIGTFAEVARTTMVRHAFARLSAIPTRLIAFSDDMDGLRRVPDNIPNREMLAEHLGKPLTAIPDPFGTHESFGHHNNARFRAFLDGFGFEYEFASAFEYYREGRFDSALRRMLECYDEVMAVMLPTLRAERRATYSPFLPICPKTGVVLQVPIIAHDADAGTVTSRDDAGVMVEVPVTGGRCKLQWKPDWAMRWYALGVDYEMSGSDLIDSVKQSSQICRILGAPPPEGFHFELFRDEQGEKISKSKGNGLSLEDWLTYASPESLA
ncbi:MAG: lysine--tRNA ligase, partial [Alphaproteobacteria bacterium]|nr:lysine--tRNA ligase [Alphaproteobacteria bacterium]